MIVSKTAALVQKNPPPARGKHDGKPAFSAAIVHGEERAQHAVVAAKNGSKRSLAPIFCGDHSVLGPLLSMHNGRAESRLAVMLAASGGWVLLDKRGGF